MRPCYPPPVIRARAGRSHPRPARLLPILAAAFLAASCTSATFTSGPRATATAEPSAAASGTIASREPSASAEFDPTPPTEPDPTATFVEPSAAAAGCTGSDENREFFRQAGASMAWAVYCAVLDDGWFLATGSYRLANGGHLEVTYQGPGDARMAVLEGDICEGTDVDTCAPRDAVIGPAAFGNQDGELGRLSNGLVLDVDRGASPTWRATGLGLSEDEFRAICAAFIAVEG